ncbi:MAG: tetratricopeptide repeat protein [Armatimonadetes bacterium]|nr:tetratricopeptide repeat protein [Armatimonadota bacterium]
MSEETQGLLQEATTLVQEQRFQDARSRIEQVLAAEPQNTDAMVLQGICLAQLGMKDEATSSFQRALSVDPSNTKILYNFATHLYQLGRKQEALSYAKQAVALQPEHNSAAQMVSLIETELQQPAAPGMAPPVVPGSPAEQSGYAQGQPYSGYTRPDVYGTPPQGGGIPFVRKMGNTWTIIGWFFAILAAVLFVYNLVHMMPYISQIMAATQKGQTEMNRITTEMQKDVNMFAQILGWVSLLGAMVWAILDLVDRRGNFLWLLGIIPCSCCGAQFIVLPIYLLFGRKS